MFVDMDAVDSTREVPGSSADAGRWSTIARFALLALGILSVVACRKLAAQASAGHGDAFIYHFAARAIREGYNPYRDPLYLYPPFWAWTMSPFAGLSAKTFAALWGALQGGIWVTAVAGIRRLSGRGDAPLSWTLDVLPSALLFRCLFNGWGHGQVALLLLALLTWAMVWDERGRPAAAGFLVALGGAIKIFPLFAAVAFVRRGSRRALAWTAIFSALLWSAPAVSLGMTRCVSLLAVDLRHSTTTRAWDRPFSKDNNAPLPMLAARAGVQDAHDMKRAVAAWTFLCTLVCVAVVARRGATARGATRSSLVMTTMLVTVPVLWTSYFTLLLLPLSTFIAIASEGAHARSGRRDSASTTALGLVIGIATLTNLSSSALGWSDATRCSGRWTMMAAAALLAWGGTLLIEVLPCPATPGLLAPYSGREEVDARWSTKFAHT